MDADTGVIYHVEDQFCDLATGTFHQNVYWDSADTGCTGSPMKQVFSSDDCLFGIQLREPCHVGPCEEVLSAENQPSSGNYFIRKELPDGTYLITFTNKYGTEKFRFVVKN